jgi:hypothetical protein
VLALGLGEPDEMVEVVLVRRKGWWRLAKSLLRAPATQVLESEAEVRVVESSR